MKKLLSILFCLMAVALYGQNRFTGANSWEEIFANAKAQQKMVIIDCYFEGCYPCKQMDDEVFPHPQVSQLMASDFIGIKTDCLKEALGKQLQMKFGVTGFPTYLIFTSNGELVDYFSGYKATDLFVGLLKAAVVKNKSGQLLTGFNNQLEGNYPAVYTSFYTERKPIRAEDLAVLLKETDHIFSENVAMPLLMSRNLSTAQADLVINSYEKLVGGYGKGLVDAQRLRIIKKRIAQTPKQLDKKWLAQLMENMKAHTDHGDWATLRLDIAESYYYNHLKDPAAFFKYAAAHPTKDDNKIRYMGMRLLAPEASAEQKRLFGHWASKVLDEHSGQEALSYYAAILMQQNKLKDAQRIAGWAVQKAMLNKVDACGPQHILNKIQH